MTIPPEAAQQIKDLGYGITGEIGGHSKQTYWTPDGRAIKTQPSIRSWIRKDKDGKVIDSGTRDANLDNGWLLQPPIEPKLYCPNCDKWHDTKEGVEKCSKSKKALEAMYARTAKEQRKDTGEKDEEISQLKAEMSEIKAMLGKLLERE